MPKIINNFDNERKDVVQKIFDILQITNDNNKFSLKELDDNLEKQKQIINLVPEIKKYFIYSKWTYFTHINRKCKRNYLSLIKAIFKTMDIKIITSILTVKNDDNTTDSETIYFIKK